VQAQLAGKVDESGFKARLGVDGFAAPAIRFDVEVDQLDVDRYLAPTPAGAKQKPAAAGPEPHFDLSGLRALRAEGTLKIGSLKANNVKGSNARLAVKANGGRVVLDPVTADFYQGKLASAITVNAAPATPTFAVRHRFNGISIGPLLKDLAESDILEGKGDVAADVTSQGNTVSALKKALNGSASLKLADGAVKGIDIAGSIRSAKAKLGALRGEHTQAADSKARTDFSELTATFKIANGVARNNDLDIKSPLLRVGGEGEVDIGADRLNYLVKASIVGTSKGQGGRELEDLKGITVPVRISGPLAAPSYKLDFGRVATDTAKQRLTDELQKRLGGGAKDGAGKDAAKPGSARDALRGLFGR
jgi:AsmA protein